MTRALAFGLLPLVAVLAFFLRERAVPGHVHEPVAGDLAPRWLVDDPDATYHLRRVGLTLASGSIPGFDRYLNHPSGSPIPWPPFADGAFAAVASVLAGGDPDDPQDRALGGHNEGEVEAVLVHVPPAVGVLVVLLVFLAVLVVVEPGPARALAGLLAAAVYAVTPVAIWYSEVTRLDHHVLVAALLALLLILVTWTARARELVDNTTGALLAGAVATLALLTWLASGVFVALCGLTLYLRVLSSDSERARSGARSGALFFVVAAVLINLPASRSAWNTFEPGSLVNLTEAVPRALFCAAIPFVAGGLVARPGRSPLVVALLSVLASGVAVPLVLPEFATALGEGFAWASRENLFMDVVGESRPLLEASTVGGALAAVVRRLSLAALLSVPATIYLAFTLRQRPERLLLVLFALVTAVMTLGQQRFGNSFAVPMACVIAVALADLWNRGGRRSRGLAVGGAMAAVLSSVLAVISLVDVADDEYRELSLWRAEVVRGLRWMRGGTPSPGPFNAADHPQDWAVLAPWGLGHQIEYHARRPTIATNFGSFVGENNFRNAARALLETEPSLLCERMHAMGARYVVVTPRFVSDLAATMRVAGEDPSELFVRTRDGRKVYGPRANRSALFRLALHAEEPGSEHVPGLRLVYAAKRVEAPTGTWPRAGEPYGPVISVYELVAPAPERREAVIGAGG